MIHKTRAVISGLRKKTVPLKMVRYKDQSEKNNHCPKMTRGDEIFAQYSITNWASPAWFWRTKMQPHQVKIRNTLNDSVAYLEAENLRALA